MGFFSGVFKKVFDDILGFDSPAPPSPPPAQPPAPTAEVGEGASDRLRRRTRRRGVSGKRQTIVTGDLTPERTGILQMGHTTKRA